MGFNAVHIGSIGSDVARHPDINQAKLAAPVQRSQTRGIDDRIIGGGTGEHQRAGAQILIQIRERPALNRKIGEISRQLFGPFNGAVQQNNTGGTFGLKVLKQQTAHAPSTDNGDLLAFQGDQLIQSPGLTELELGELNGRRADRNRSCSEVGFTADTFARGDGLGEQAIQDRTQGFVLLAEPHHFFHLGEDLTFPQHKAVETCCHPHQMVDSVFVVETEKVRSQLSCLKAGVAAEEVANSRHAKVRIADQRVNLKAIAGAEDGCLEHLLIAAKGLKGRLHGLLRDAEPFPDLHRCRAMTEADDGDMHEDVPLNQWVTISSERCSGRRL